MKDRLEHRLTAIETNVRWIMRILLPTFLLTITSSIKILFEL